MDLLYSKLAQTLIFCKIYVQIRLFHRSRENEYFTCSVTCSILAVKTVHGLSYAKRINDSVKEKNQPLSSLSLNQLEAKIRY